MSSYFKPIKKFVSRKVSIERLHLDNKRFDRLCVLNCIYPTIIQNKNRYDKVDGWYYKIDDIKKLYYSASYQVSMKNKQLTKRIDRFLDAGLKTSAERIKLVDTNFVELVKNRYPTLGLSFENLGSTISNLYLMKLLMLGDTGTILSCFESFISENSLIDRAFLAKTRTYFSFTLGSIIVLWSIPYKNNCMEGLVEEKKEIPEVDEAVYLDFLDFGDFIKGEEPDIQNDANDAGKLDVSLLNYGGPLYTTHLELCLFKLKSLLASNTLIRKRPFMGIKFFVAVESIKMHAELIIKSGGGIITEVSLADIVLTEAVDKVDDKKKYVQPQFIFDSLNSNKMLPYFDYAIGKDLPTHTSPFPNIFETIDKKALNLLSNRQKNIIESKIKNLD